MSTTTQILFNSPALHSLKRDQLVKLCKIHSIKASGKNVELVEKLKQHALTLQTTAPDADAKEDLESNGAPASDEVIQKQDPVPTQHDQEGNCSDADAELNTFSTDSRQHAPRPSEQWEIVMESIEELDEDSGPGSSQNTLASKGTYSSSRTIGNSSSTGEFGTGGSKSSVGSSIKALASSLGLNRMRSTKSTLSASSSFESVPPVPKAPSKFVKQDELELNSTPYSAIPHAAPMDLPLSDNLTFTPPQYPVPRAFDDDAKSVVFTAAVPLPGHPLRPGVPVPSVPNARLSLGLSTPDKGAGPSTTVRLVSAASALASSGSVVQPCADSKTCTTNSDSWAEGNTPKLKPYATTFDLVLGSPGPIYPVLSFDDHLDNKVMPGALQTGSPSDESARSAPPSQSSLPNPFMFGSPLPQHRLSNAQFQDAAKTVLEEMNKRLQSEGVSGVSTNLLKQLDKDKRSAREAAAMPESASAKTREAERREVRERFAKAHDEAFGQMASIAERPGATMRTAPSVLGQKRKSSALDDDVRAVGKRRPTSTAPVVNRAAGTRVISGGRRKARVIPGGFSDDDESDDDNDAGGGPGVEDGERAGKRVRLSIAGGKSTGEGEPNKDDADRREKEREAIKRRLEINKARRRSSMGVGRQSIGRGRVSAGRQMKPNPKPSRFGFLSSAKNLVQGVWNRSKGATKPAPAAKPPSSGIPVVAKPTPRQLANTGSSSKGSSSSSSTTKETGLKVSSSQGRNSKLLGPESNTKSGTVRSNASRSRSPIPSFGSGAGRAGGGGVNGSTASSLGTKTGPARASSATPSVGNRSTVMTGSLGTRSSAGVSRVSSLGTRASRASVVSNGGEAGSKGTRSSLLSKALTAKATASTSSRASTSRLLAPTASSLAKTVSPRTSTALEPVKESGRDAALGSITNNHGTLATTPSPKHGVLSKHLASPSGIPSPIRVAAQPMSLGAASATLSQGAAARSAKSVAPKPRSLSGRKPRISRSKVIAKLAEQRAASGGDSGAASSSRKLRPSAVEKRTRSSLGTKIQRQSLGGGLKAGRHEAILAAKRKARASEHVRRRSARGVENTRSDTMDVSDT